MLAPPIEGLLEELKRARSGPAGPDVPAGRQCLRALADSGEFRVVARLLPVLTEGSPFGSDAAAAIDALVRNITPARLAWLDEQARSWSYATRGVSWEEWRKLPRESVRTFARFPGAVGVLASHPSGYVRQDAVEELGRNLDGREIPFLVLRSNDWVEAVAQRAQELLAARLVVANLPAVLSALPFLVRMPGYRRRGHAGLVSAFKTLLLYDRGSAALHRVRGFDTLTGRALYEILWSEASSDPSTVVDAALADADPLIRRRALRRLVLDVPHDAVATLERVVLTDRVPAVRKEALALIADLSADRTGRLLQEVLLDPAASVREFARHLVRALSAAVDPRGVCLAGLSRTMPRQLAGAIEGLGEVGSPADAAGLTGFCDAAAPRVRRAVLRALGTLDPDAGRPRALAALADPSGSVRTAALRLLTAEKHRLDFTALADLAGRLPDERARATVLTLLAEGPKWQAAALLLGALGDPGAAVRVRASALLDVWVATFNRRQVEPTTEERRRIGTLLDAHGRELSTSTIDLLRFSLRSS